MTPEFEYSTLANPEDIQRLGDILNQSFIEFSNDEEYFHSIGIDNFRIIRQREQIAGGLGILSMGQWWGGANVPMGGIGAVAIAPEYRGTGAAITMMQHTVKELYALNIPISTLYPAVQRLYRKAGYEQAGENCIWEVETESIQLRESPLLVQAVPLDVEIFAPIYQKQAQLTNGHLERHQFIWNSVIKPFGKEKYYAYIIGVEPQGYIVFSQDRKDGSYIRIRDWALLTPAACQSFWYFMANHRSQIDKVRWKSSLVDSLSLILPQTAEMKSTGRWMLRIVDLVKALEKRGYPQGIQAELHLEVKDDLIAENNGKFILSVANGRGEVTKGGKGELQTDIRGLSPLYTGFFAPQQLQLMGKLESTATALTTATGIFAGSPPWMADFF
jgi:predicted acetyltransferase